MVSKCRTANTLLYKPIVVKSLYEATGITPHHVKLRICLWKSELNQFNKTFIEVRRSVRIHKILLLFLFFCKLMELLLGLLIDLPKK